MHTFEVYPADTIARAVALQFSIYREILKAHGNNTYNLPRSNIRKRQIAGEEEIDFNVQKEVVLSTAKWVLDEIDKFGNQATSEYNQMRGDSQKKKDLQAKKTQWNEKKAKWFKIYETISNL